MSKEKMRISIKELVLEAAEIAGEKKANDIQILDLEGLTVIADYFLICSGNSDTQVKAIARAVEEKLAAEGIVPRKVAGKQEARWVLLDYADFVVHVFHENDRKYYELERLWADAEKILLNS
ncbi:MAG TPA: ribosome silencing factor [Halanaerobiales bacterium]|nr:ribosome silencing factor [Halanaerobiales bacterium]